MGAGGGIGMVSALLSIGGGTMTVPFLAWQGVKMRQVIGTSAALGVPISCLGTLGYMFFSHQKYDMWGVWGLVNIPMVLLISWASRSTIAYGVLCCQRFNVQLLRRMFACLFIILSLNMVYVMR